MNLRHSMTTETGAVDILAVFVAEIRIATQ